MEDHLVQVSKFLSYILRHNPGSIGVKLDQNGWTNIEDLIALSNQAGTKLTPTNLLAAVQQNDKKRFTISDDGLRLRAAQGHSIDVNLGIQPQVPPEMLFHGTATRFLESIIKSGINAGSRQQVHLSLDKETALKVGQRHGIPTILVIKAKLMHQKGFKFYLSDNGVWLTDQVPPEFISLVE